VEPFGSTNPTLSAQAGRLLTPLLVPLRDHQAQRCLDRVELLPRVVARVEIRRVDMVARNRPTLAGVGSPLSRPPNPESAQLPAAL
jgi:hypothetical protein